jgi:hypothetical protein
MPNWCYSNIRIYHDDKEKLKAFLDKVEEWRSKPYVCNDFDNGSLGWLGNIVGNSGLAEYKIRDDGGTDFVPNIRCRGSLQQFDFRDSYIDICTETAWGPMMEMWRLLCEKYLPEAEILFSSEECGCGMYVSNDPDILGTYYIDIWENPDGFDEYTECEADEKYTIDFLQRVLKTDESDIEKLLKMADDIEDQWFSINKWEYCDINTME